MNIRSFALKITVLFLGCVLAVMSSSCRKTAGKEDLQNEFSIGASSHTWFYFDESGFRKTDRPQNAPTVPKKPWTEAVRIAAASCADDAGDSAPKAYAVVNRRGILVFEKDRAALYNDTGLFNGRTAENIVFQENTPVFSLYRSSFFNDHRNENTYAIHPFLVQFNPDSCISFPVINADNLGLNKNSEVTDFIWDGQFWTCCIKTTGPEKIDFSYLTFQAKKTLLSISPAQASENLIISEADVKDFRKQKEPRQFSEAPERLRKLLSALPETAEYTVNCRTAGGYSPRLYIHSMKNAENVQLAANAIIADTWAGALFYDGTMFLNGALYERRILNNGKTVAIRLPKLPAGYRYGEFVISGTSLYAAWEENSFFETGRSGFLSVDLDTVLYKIGEKK